MGIEPRSAATAEHLARTPASESTPTIPVPPGHFLLGNAPDLGRVAPLQSLMSLARRYGEIFRLRLPGRSPIVVSSFALVDEVCSDKRFDKKVAGGVAQLRPLGGDGLFTAATEEPNWRKAHNILMAAFSHQAMRNYFDTMRIIADQLADKWQRMGPGADIDVAADMTRLTLETIARCGFDYSFQSFSSESLSPFVAAMLSALREGLERAQRLPIEEMLSLRRHRRFEQDISHLFSVVDAVIAERRKAGDSRERTDLLSLMLHGVDKDTGERLDDVNIRHQIITFLIAGHETTSGLLSFALYFLLQSPAIMAAAVREVDGVLGPDPAAAVEFTHLPQLKYVTQVLKESLRLWPTAPAFTRRPRGETMIAGKYPVHASDNLIVLTAMLHRDRSVWGENAESFDPAHFSSEAEAKRPPNAFLPFGTGMRSCIGRFFAMQEATLVLAMLLRRFTLSPAGPYTLKVKETLTLKPDGFLLRAAPRLPVARPAGQPQGASGAKTETEEKPAPGDTPRHDTPLLVLYGSNMGTSEELARQLVRDSEAYGYAAEASPMDGHPGSLPRAGAVIIVTSSYNGNPPDNAMKFGAWLADAGEKVPGVRYAVFGCGHHDWAATFQAFPTFIDTRLESAGATRVMDRGSGDSGGDLFGDFRAWRRALWEKLPGALGIAAAARVGGARTPLYGIEVVNEQQPNPFVTSFAARPMVIVENRELQGAAAGGRPARCTRHIELALPDGVSYRAGDHLGVIARNHRDTVRRVLARFGFDEDTVIRLRRQGRGAPGLPVDRAISVVALLSDYLELQDAATQDQVAVLAEHTQSPSDRTQLLALCGEEEAARELFRREILFPRTSLIDLLEEYPTCALPFGVYLEMLSPLRPRYFSISSSPQRFGHICTITVAVVEEPARSGRGMFHGVCSNFLASKLKGDSVFAFVRDPGTPFRPPRNPRTSMIMVGTGTGVAPFIGFLQERAWLKGHDYTVGPSLLFFGCRHPERDFYYRGELEEYCRDGLLELAPAFSRADPAGKTYVQDRIRERADRVWELLQEGAVVYVCGDANRIAPAVRAAFGEVYRAKTGCGEAQRDEWLNEMVLRQRYLIDVWASK